MMLTVRAWLIVALSRSWAASVSAARASLAVPTAPSVRSLAVWMASHRTRVPAWSATASLTNAVMASVYWRKVDSTSATEAAGAPVRGMPFSSSIIACGVSMSPASSSSSSAAFGRTSAL
jgi:hypothetical protein